MDSENQQICRDFVRTVILSRLSHQTPEKQAFRGVCPHDFPREQADSLHFTAPSRHAGENSSPSFLSNSTIANIVGYQEVAVPTGSSMRTATFKAIEGSYKISDMKVTGAVGAGGDVAQKINADGTWGDMYYYYTMDGSYWLEDGWYKDDAGTPVTDADVLAVGEALIFTAAGDFTIQFAGQVIDGQPTVTVPVGSSIIGNPTPVNVEIGNITVEGAVGAGGDVAQKINADGTWGDMYYYYTMDGSYWLEDGWYKDDAGTPVTSADLLNAGESMIFTSAAGMTLKFPVVIN